MEPQTYPDPFRDALHHGLQRAVQIASSAVTGAQVLLYLQRTHTRMRLERHEQARLALDTQVRVDRAATRARWTPALDPEWIRHADLAATARAWGAALPFADLTTPWHERSATIAMDRCEERLRVLHPFAMARYDRLRAKGTPPADAMREAAPLFGYSPHAREGHYSPRQALLAGQSASPGAPPVPPDPGPGEQPIAPPGATPATSGPAAQADHSTSEPPSAATPGAAQARQSGDSPLPGSDASAPHGPGTPHMRSPGPAQARERPAFRPWLQDFPLPIREVIATAATAVLDGKRAVNHPTPARHPARSPGRQP